MGSRITRDIISNLHGVVSNLNVAIKKAPDSKDKLCISDLIIGIEIEKWSGVCSLPNLTSWWKNT